MTNDEKRLSRVESHKAERKTFKFGDKEYPMPTKRTMIIGAIAMIFIAGLGTDIYHKTKTKNYVMDQISRVSTSYNDVDRFMNDDKSLLILNETNNRDTLKEVLRDASKTASEPLADSSYLSKEQSAKFARSQDKLSKELGYLKKIVNTEKSLRTANKNAELTKEGLTRTTIRLVPGVTPDVFKRINTTIDELNNQQLKENANIIYNKALNEYNLQDAANKAISLLYRNGEVISSNEDAYNKALTAVDKITDPLVYDKYAGYLKKVKKAIEERKDYEQKQQDAKRKAEEIQRKKQAEEDAKRKAEESKNQPVVESLEEKRTKASINRRIQAGLTGAIYINNTRVLVKDGNEYKDDAYVYEDKDTMTYYVGKSGGAHNVLSLIGNASVFRIDNRSVIIIGSSAHVENNEKDILEVTQEYPDNYCIRILQDDGTVNLLFVK